MKKKKYNFDDVSKAFTLSNPGETNEFKKRAQLAQATGDISLIMDNKKVNLDEILAGKTEVQDDKTISEDIAANASDKADKKDSADMHSQQSIDTMHTIDTMHDIPDSHCIDSIDTIDNQSDEVVPDQMTGVNENAEQTIEEENESVTSENEATVELSKKSTDKKKENKKEKTESLFTKYFTDENYNKLSDEYDARQSKDKISIVFTEANRIKLQNLASKYMMPSSKMLNYIMYAIFDVDTKNVKEVVKEYELDTKYKFSIEKGIKISILERYNHLLREIRYRYGLSPSSFFNQILDKM